MEIFRCTNGMGTGHSWSPSTFSAMALSLAAAGSSVCPAKSATISGPHSPESGDICPLVDPSVKLTAAKECALKLETVLTAMQGMEGPEVELVRAAHKRAPRGSPGWSTRHPNRRVRIVPRKSCFPFGGVEAVGNKGPGPKCST